MAAGRFWSAALGAALAVTGLLPAAGPAPVAAADHSFVYGITIADASPAAGRSFDLARQAGFTHAYVVLSWSTVEPERGRFAWDMGQANDLDNFLAAARATGMRLIVRLGYNAPVWAASPATVSPADFERTAAGIAARARGVATAYEILNEPNLPYEWGAAPDPVAYTRLLAAANRGIKGVDPSALVVSAGLAPNTGGQGGTIEDVDFLRRMYQSGARGTFDVMGMHPYGGNAAPTLDPASCGICFRRAELYRQVMVENGDSATSAWVTEFGYLHTTTVDLGQYNWLKVSPDQQAQYLVGAYQYTQNNWPWLSGMVAFNLDFDTVPWNPNTMGAYWFALLNPDRSPRPAYTALKAMAKPGADQPLAVAQPAPTSTPAPPAGGSSGQTAATTSSVTCTTVKGKAVCGPAGLVSGYRR